MNIFFFIFASFVSADLFVEKAFSQWSKKHGKTYASNLVTIKRYNIFKGNFEWINKRNAELQHMQVGLNQFADMTQEEFLAVYIHPINETTYSQQLRKQGISVWQKPKTDFSGDVVNGKCQTPVRNQGQCGSCWAFSAAGVIESVMCIPGGGGDVNCTNAVTYQWVSTQEFVDCTENGCNGGVTGDALGWAVHSNNVCVDSKYPYTARRGSCQSQKCTQPSTKLSLCYCHERDGGLQYSLAESFVSIAIDASGLDFRFYKSGTFNAGVNCGHQRINHAVIAVELEGGIKGTYTVKNSWGVNWGEQGYFKMPAGVNCLGVARTDSAYVFYN